LQKKIDMTHQDKRKLFIIKIGGNVIDDKENLTSFLKIFSSILTQQQQPVPAQSSQAPLQGMGAILVHGGGKIATKIGEQLGIESKYINGRRITDDATIDLVTMVYGGLVNKKIVAQLQAAGVNAIGLTGADANIIPASKRPVKEVDFGWVGDIATNQVQTSILKLMIDSSLTPVVAPLTHDGQGHILNTNADTIASSLAVALSAEYDVRLIYCFEKKGVLEDVADEQSVITFINKEKYQQLLQENKLFEGILPKLENAFAAIDAGVHEVLIGDAKDLLQNTSDKTTGTLITA
jgi:acetylglutamate kinase